MHPTWTVQTGHNLGTLQEKVAQQLICPAVEQTQSQK